MCCRDEQARPAEAGAQTPEQAFSGELRHDWRDTLPELSYPFHERELLVAACGRICTHRKRVNISTVRAGQKLGLKEVDDGIWLVTFMAYDLGYIDLEQQTLQPLDNPFGPRLLPM